MHQIVTELDKTIKAQGGAGITDMTTMTVFITDVRLGDRLMQIRKEIFKDCFPASALISVSGLACACLSVFWWCSAGRFPSTWAIACFRLRA